MLRLLAASSSWTDFAFNYFSPTFRVNVTNTGSLNGDDVVLLFLSPPNAGQGRAVIMTSDPSPLLDGNPIQFLAGFERINLNPGQSAVVNFELSAIELSVADKLGTFVMLCVVVDIVLQASAGALREHGPPALATRPTSLNSNALCGINSSPADMRSSQVDVS
jgi:hypothetical protein